MSIEELTRRKVQLTSRLTAISMWNTYGQSIDAMAAVQLDKANTMRELRMVEKQIYDYIEGRLTQEDAE